jgi:hypothetical protein
MSILYPLIGDGPIAVWKLNCYLAKGAGKGDITDIDRMGKE